MTREGAEYPLAERVASNVAGIFDCEVARPKTLEQGNRRTVRLESVLRCRVAPEMTGIWMPARACEKPAVVEAAPMDTQACTGGEAPRRGNVCACREDEPAVNWSALPKD